MPGVNFYRFNAKKWHIRQILREKVAFFYRFNAKNWHFRQILRQKVAFFTDKTRKIGVFQCTFYSPKILSLYKKWQIKGMGEKYSVCLICPVVCIVLSFEEVYLTEKIYVDFWFVQLYLLCFVLCIGFINVLLISKPPFLSDFWVLRLNFFFLNIQHSIVKKIAKGTFITVQDTLLNRDLTIL